jgi:phage shock protein PspC (stress-responsive transcriptional regulator)
MKKVININFQGRVIPIEETAYDMLKQYVESLRRFFADEEGRDEIINDIEGRIAELFGESLKKGNTCITDDEVNHIIEGMGRPEDFEGEEGKVQSQLGSEKAGGSKTSSAAFEPAAAEPRGRLYRDDNDKILGGVCGGLGSYLRIDPTIVRLVFALLSFGAGTGILIYILLWIILPSRPLNHTSSTKRMYRNPDEKVIAGVASGIASYFDIAVWIPRIIFALPLVAGIVSSIFGRIFWFDHDPFPNIIFGSFGGTLFVVYAVLWAVIPEAKSASEKLEMRGEKVDLNTIKNTIQEDLEGFKARAEKWGGEMKDRAQEFGKDFGNTASQKAQQFSTEATYVARSSGSRIGGAIGILFKAFFLFIAGIAAFALLVALIALMSAGIGVFPLKDFFLEGVAQNMLAWATILLFLGVPVIAFITWVIRRIMGVKSKKKYLGFIFAGLWVIGLICGGLLAASIARNFDARARDKQEYVLQQPSTGKLIVNVPDSKVKVIGGRWFRMDGLLTTTGDSMLLNNVQLHLVKSNDSLFHFTAYKESYGADEAAALHNVKEITYGISQQDSVLDLDRGFSIHKGTRFRNQNVTVILQIPLGKKIVIKSSVHRRLNNNFHINSGNHGDWDFEEEWDRNDYEDWSSDVEYIMTAKGLERVNKKHEEEENNDDRNDAIEQFKKSREELQKELDRKTKETEDLKKELQKPVDTTTTPKYKYQKATTYTITPDTNKATAEQKTDDANDNASPAEISRITFMQMVL